MVVTDKVQNMIAPSLEAMGFDLVLVRMIEAGGKHTLQIMAERRDEEQMSVDDCADISRTVSALLDVEDPISGAYHLEVSSPGIDRPLVKPEDYERFSGYEVKIDLATALEGRKRFKGKVLASDKDSVTLESGGATYTIPFSRVQFAKLMLTDELIREHLRNHKRLEAEKGK